MPKYSDRDGDGTGPPGKDKSPAKKSHVTNPFEEHAPAATTPVLTVKERKTILHVTAQLVLGSIVVVGTVVGYGVLLIAMIGHLLTLDSAKDVALVLSPVATLAGVVIHFFFPRAK